MFNYEAVSYTHLMCIRDRIVESRDTEISLDEIKELYGVTVTESNGIGTLVFEKLKQHENVAELEVEDGCFFIKYSEPEKGLSLRELLKMNLNDIHLCHKDEEHQLDTIVELNDTTLTEYGRDEWKDVLDSKVEGIYQGHYGVQFAVSGVEPERLEYFSYLLSGRVDVQYYEKCINDNDQNQSITQEM